VFWLLVTTSNLSNKITLYGITLILFFLRK